MNYQLPFLVGLTTTLALGLSPAHAQPAPTVSPVAVDAPVLDVAKLSGQAGYKSRGIATGLAVGGVVTAFGIVTVGLSLDNTDVFLGGVGLAMIAPSFGHVYAEEYGHALLTSGLRSAGMVAATAGLLSDLTFEEDSTINYPLLVGGLALTAVATGYDLYDAHRAVDRTNRQRARALASVGIAPLISRQATGLVLAGTF